MVAIYPVASFPIAGNLETGIFGILNATEAADIAAINVTSAHLIVLGAIENSDVASFIGVVEWRLILDAVEAPDVSNIVGIVETQLVLVTTEESDLVSFNGVNVFEFEHIIGKGLEIDLSGIVFLRELQGRGKMFSLIGSSGEILSGSMGVVLSGRGDDEIADISGKAIEVDLSGIARLIGLNGRAREVDLIGSMGKAISGRALQPTLNGRETTK